MTHYIELLLKKNSEYKENILLREVYSKLHKTLYDLKTNSIAVSFPNKSLTLGNILRLHSSREELEKLEELRWLGELQNYCKKSEIRKVPSDVQFQCISRIRETKSNSKLQRFIRRNNPSEEEIKSYKLTMLKNGLENPFIELLSNSTSQRYRIYFKFSEIQGSAVEGKFNFFGLSRNATVPVF